MNKPVATKQFAVKTVKRDLDTQISDIFSKLITNQRDNPRLNRQCASICKSYMKKIALELVQAGEFKLQNEILQKYNIKLE